MLKTRIIPTLLWKDVGLVKGIGFDSGRRVGTLLPAVKVYCSREVDELVLLDITATKNGNRPDFSAVKDVAKEISVPFAVGGGVRSIEDITELLLSGADKVVINTAAYTNPALISAGAAMFGAQCIVVAIDFRRIDGKIQCYSHSGTKLEAVNLVEWAKKLQDLGAGELIVTSIDRDGTMEGYDCEVIASVADAVSIPVIASGGAGNAQHILDVLLKGKATAAAAASIFHFTEQTPLEIKQYLGANGINIRQ